MDGRGHPPAQRWRGRRDALGNDESGSESEACHDSKGKGVKGFGTFDSRQWRWVTCFVCSCNEKEHLRFLSLSVSFFFLIL
jgi:hypothetical protein